MINWHKKYIKWWKKKLNISDYGILWISFIKGLIIGLLIYHFFINWRKRNKMTYDKNNIFAKILKGEIPCKKIYEDEFVFAFHDINPQKKVHALVIPKGEYINLDDFSSKATEKEIVGLIKGIGTVAKKLGVSEVVKGRGYRSLVNVGENGGQEVPHLHFHIFGGEKIGKMVS